MRRVAWVILGSGVPSKVPLRHLLHAKRDLISGCLYCHFMYCHPKASLGSLIAQLVKNLPAMQETPVPFLEIPWRRERLPIPVFLGFPCGSVGKESACNAGDLSSIPGLERWPGEGKSYPLQDSGLENSTDCIFLGVTESHMTEQLSISLRFPWRLR